jgi:hypothetical protein
MAEVKFINGSSKSMPADKAYVLWQVFNGDITGNPEQQTYCTQIRGMVLNWRKAPDSYLYTHAHSLIPIVKNTFMCDRAGKLTRPEFSDADGWRVAKLLELV